MYTIQKQYYRELELNELEKLGVFLINGRLILIANELFKNGHSNKCVEEIVSKINEIWYKPKPGRQPILMACRKVTIVVYEDDKVKGEAQFPLVVATTAVLLNLADRGIEFKAITVYCDNLNKVSRKTIIKLLTTAFPQVGRRVMVEYRFHLVIKNPTIGVDMTFADCRKPWYINWIEFL